MADPAFLTSKYKEALLASGSLPEPEPISSDYLANANLDIDRAEYPIFQLASLALKQEVEENAKSAGVYATIKILAVCIVVLLVTALGANVPPKDFVLFAHYAQQNDSMGSGVNKQIFSTVESVGYLGASNISLVGGEITTFGAAGLYHLSSPSVTTWHDAESLDAGYLPVGNRNPLQEHSASEIAEDLMLTDEQRVQFQQLSLKYAPFTTPSNASEYHRLLKN